MLAVINVIGFIRKDQTMHNDANKRGRSKSPLEKIMMDIKDTSMDIFNIAGWLGDPQYGRIQDTREQLKICSDKLDTVYNKLRELTGAHPCK